MAVKNLRLPLLVFLCLNVLYDGMAQESLMKSVKRGVLPNGFTYYLQHTSDSVVAVRFLVAAGYAQETMSQNQVSHLIEHLCFRKTKRFTDALSYFQKYGISKGDNFNATTGDRSTTYYMDVPVGRKNVLFDAVRFFRDCAHDADLTAEAVALEKGVVEREVWRSADSLIAIRGYFLSRLTDDPLAQYKTESDAGLANRKLSLKEVKEYYKQWYQPRNQCIALVGNFDVTEAEQLIKNEFSGLKNTRKEYAPYSDHFSGKNQYVALATQKIDASKLDLYVKRPNKTITSLSDVDYRVIVELTEKAIIKRLEHIRSGEIGFNSRLFMVLDQNSGVIATDFDAYNLNYSFDSEMFQREFKKALTISERLRRFGITQTEFDEVIKEYIKRLNYGYITPRQKSDYLTRSFIDGSLWRGSHYDTDLEMDIVKSLTVPDINKMIGSWLQLDSNVNIFLQVPVNLKRKIPGENDVWRWIREVRDSVLTNDYENESSPVLLDREVVDGLKAAPYEVGFDTAAAISILRYANGVTVYLKPIADGNIGTISMYSFQEIDAKTDGPSKMANLYAPVFVSNSGFDGLTSENVQQFYRSQGVQYMQPYIGDIYSGFDSEFDPEGLESALQAVYSYCTKPKIDSSVFYNILKFRLNELKTKKVDVVKLELDSLKRTTFACSDMQETFGNLSRISPESSLKAFVDAFGNAKERVFVFAGDFDVAALTPVLSKYLGNLPYKNGANAKNYTRGKSCGDGSSHLRKEVRSMDGGEASIRIVYAGNYNFTTRDNAYLELLARIIEHKLLFRLRAVESKIYMITVSCAYVNSEGGQFSINIGFGCASKDARYLMQCAEEEMATLRSGLMSADLLDKVKSVLINKVVGDLSRANFWGAYICDQYRNHQPVSEILEKMSLIKSATIQNVQYAAELFLDVDHENHLIVIPDEKM